MKLHELYTHAKKEMTDMDSFDAVIIASAAQEVLDSEVSAPEAVEEVTEGAQFVIPLLIPEGVESGDGRIIKEGALTTRELPLPILWQVQTADGHGGSVIVGRVDSIERVDGGLGNARGVFDVGPWGKEAERLVRGGFLRGVSADLDNFRASAVDMEEEDEGQITTPKLQIDSARIIACTLVAKPAYAEAHIELAADDLHADDEETVVASAALEEAPASTYAATPPAEWFADPKLTKPTPINVTADGRVFGHIAAWEQSHIGLPNNIRPPRSKSGYAYFTTGSVTTAEGTEVAVGNLTLSGGHAPLNADAMSAVKHYDDTASAIADVAAGEDAYGIWVAGSVRASATPEQVRALKASAPSGDWRPINGRLELVAVCQVNVPGFPIPRANAVTASGSLCALVAAGADYMAAVREQESLEALAASARERISEHLRDDELKVNKDFAIQRINDLR